MPPVLGLLQFTHSQKAAFTISCFDLTTDFQPGMLNSMQNERKSTNKTNYK